MCKTSVLFMISFFISMPGAALAAPAINTGGNAMTLKLESPAFTHNSAVPLSCTCDGSETSPALNWAGAPAGTKSFALIVDDPDAPDPAAPKMIYVHWVLFNIPANVNGLPEGMKALPQGAREGLNDEKQTGYVGPCPPIGTHRYFHKLYALDALLDLPGVPSKADLEKAMQGHILEQATLMGTYVRSKK